MSLGLLCCLCVGAGLLGVFIVHKTVEFIEEINRLSRLGSLEEYEIEDRDY